MKNFKIVVQDSRDNKWYVVSKVSFRVWKNHPADGINEILLDGGHKIEDIYIKEISLSVWCDDKMDEEQESQAQFETWLREVKFPHLTIMGAVQYEYCGDGWQAGVQWERKRKEMKIYDDPKMYLKYHCVTDGCDYIAKFKTPLPKSAGGFYHPPTLGCGKCDTPLLLTIELKEAKSG